MKKNDTKPFLVVIMVIFTAVALIHFIRLSLSWDFIINNWNLPTELSGLISFVSAFLVYWSWIILQSRDDKETNSEENIEVLDE